MFSAAPAIARIHTHLARGELTEAASQLRLLLARSPSHPQAHFLAAVVHLRRGDFDLAIHHARQAVRLDAANPFAHNALGAALFLKRDFTAAAGAYSAALQLDPDFVDASTNLGEALEALVRYADAEEAYRRALLLSPHDHRALTSIARLLLTTGRAAEAVDLVTVTRDAAPNDPRFQSMLCIALNYSEQHTADAIVEEHRRFGRLFSALPRPPWRTRRTGEPLRVGYISPDFRSHSVAYFIRPILANYDRSLFKVHCYSTGAVSDAMTTLLRPLADVWRDVAPLDDASLAELIRSDRIDVLIDLAGHTPGGRPSLLALRPAPVQATYIGYPNTTGLSAVDARFVDSITDPPPADALAVERLVRLDPCFLCYAPPDDAPAPSPPPSRAQGRITFASFNTLSKVGPRVLDAWAGVLSRVPDSRLLMKAPPLSDPSVRDRFTRVFADRSITPDRLTLLGHTESRREHLALYATADIALDTFPYAGTTTTCEALWMGVPVVTLAGESHAGRVGASLLAAASMREFVAASADEYINTACTLAANPERLTVLRSEQRVRMAASPLCDAPAFTRRFEQALLRLSDADSVTRGA